MHLVITTIPVATMITYNGIIIFAFNIFKYIVYVVF